MVANDKITLTYFDIRGRVEPIRLLLEDAGLKYDDIKKFDWKVEKTNKYALCDYVIVY